MYFFLSTLAKSVVSPFNWSLILWGIGFIVYWRSSPKWGIRLGIGGILLLFVFSIPVVGISLLGALEDDFPNLGSEEYAKADAIVVLGGFTIPPRPGRRDIEVNGAFNRLLKGMRLLRAGKAPLLILTGGQHGSVVLKRPEDAEAECGKILALECGVDPEVILTESRARNTYENALFTKELLQERGLKKILLVTSAYHMPRAVGVFRTQGIDVIAAPTGVQIRSSGFKLTHLLPGLGALGQSSSTMREYLALSVYRWKGWITEPVNNATHAKPQGAD